MLESFTASENYITPNFTCLLPPLFSHSFDEWVKVLERTDWFYAHRYRDHLSHLYKLFVTQVRKDPLIAYNFSMMRGTTTCRPLKQPLSLEVYEKCAVTQCTILCSSTVNV